VIKTVAEELFAALNARDFAKLDQLAPDVVEHNAVVVDAPTQGPGAFAKAMEQAFAAFPDLRLDVEDMIAEDDRVVVRLRVSATNTGDYRRGAPTGKGFTSEAYYVLRVADGKVVETWGLGDRLAVLQQLGIVGSDDELATVGRIG
jgi:predicted ester cyclase